MSHPIRILSCIIILATISCNSSNNNDAKKIPSTDTQRQTTLSTTNPVRKVRANNQLTDAMLTQIIDHYKKEYGGDSVHMSITRSDTIVEVSFENTAIGPEDYGGVLFMAYISLVTDINPIITGDMNGDGLNDLLVTVHTEGGGGGGNVWWSDHFVFLASPGEQYLLTDVKSDGELLEGSGYFFPEAITNQAITGISNEYTESDGHCCPSLYYRIQLRLMNGELQEISRKEIDKPAGFE